VLSRLATAVWHGGQYDEKHPPALASDARCQMPELQLQLQLRLQSSLPIANFALPACLPAAQPSDSNPRRG
jgi:hypothetical protein